MPPPGVLSKRVPHEGIHEFWMKELVLKLSVAGIRFVS